jgi:hypothetical protein
MSVELDFEQYGRKVSRAAEAEVAYPDPTKHPNADLDTVFPVGVESELALCSLQIEPLLPYEPLKIISALLDSLQDECLSRR